MQVSVKFYTNYSWVNEVHCGDASKEHLYWHDQQQLLYSPVLDGTKLAGKLCLDLGMLFYIVYTAIENSPYTKREITYIHNI